MQSLALTRTRADPAGIYVFARSSKTASHSWARTGAPTRARASTYHGLIWDNRHRSAAKPFRPSTGFDAFRALDVYTSCQYDCQEKAQQQNLRAHSCELTDRFHLHPPLLLVERQQKPRFVNRGRRHELSPLIRVWRIPAGPAGSDLPPSETLVD